MEMPKKKISQDKKLQDKVKKLLAKAKRKDLIKSHELAFEETPVKQEEHKGKITAFR